MTAYYHEIKMISPFMICNYSYLAEKKTRAVTSTKNDNHSFLQQVRFLSLFSDRFRGDGVPAGLLLYLTNSISPSRHVLSNHGSSGP